MSDLLPLFVNLSGRSVLLVGAGPVAAGKLAQLVAAGARVRVVAPEVHADVARVAAEHADLVRIERRPFQTDDVRSVWFVVAAAPPGVNRAVADAAEREHVLVNAVDDPPNASAYLGGVVRRGGVTLAISTSGAAPGLTALLRPALDALLPSDIGKWVSEARRLRAAWRKNRVPIGARRPLLLETLNGLYDSAPDARPPREPRTVPVALVGAGPGDPALLTRAAAARLRAADLVLYDALVDERVLRLARRAQRFFVGKRAGRHSLAQADIHAVMIRAARRGRRVVRLKGGDPFVFGRGGEEAAALLQANIPFEVVPGISAAIAAPALSGIPVTHRGLASAFIVVSGHDVRSFVEAIAGVAVRGVTVVVLMGMGRRAAIAAALLERGWSSATPAALIVDASRNEQVWRGTLAELAAGRATTVEPGGPATLVVGEVAAMDLRTPVDAPTAVEARGRTFA